ncbi:MAG: hypothetical protein GY864_10280 [Desulfobacterales bacterium]|nr:hypothetical protein [Desulfobacterales bacterium]
MTNKTGEAYTGNTAGRRGAVPPQSNSASLDYNMQLATVLTSWKPAQRNRFGEILEGLPGSKSVACSERSVRNLGDPSASYLEVGRFNQKKGVRWAEGSQIIS